MYKAGVTDQDVTNTVAAFKQEYYATRGSKGARWGTNGSIEDITLLWGNDLYGAVVSSEIRSHIAVIERLSKVPSAITEILDPNQFSVATRVEEYHPIAHMFTINPELKIAFQEIFAAYYEKLLPQLLKELQLYIDTDTTAVPVEATTSISAHASTSASISKPARIRLVITNLTTLRNNQHLVLQTTSITSYLQKVFEGNRSPAQKLIDQKVDAWNSELRQLEKPQDTRGFSVAALFKR